VALALQKRKKRLSSNKNCIYQAALMMTVQTQSTTSAQDPPKSKSRSRFDFFVIRFLLVTAALLLIMAVSNVNIGSIGQGLAYALVGVSVYITFRILNFPDLTVDGAFSVGGALCAAIIVAGG